MSKFHSDFLPLDGQENAGQGENAPNFSVTFTSPRGFTKKETEDTGDGGKNVYSREYEISDDMVSEATRLARAALPALRADRNVGDIPVITRTMQLTKWANLRYMSVQNNEDVRIEISPRLKEDSEGEDDKSLHLMVAHSGNQLTAIPMGSVYTGTLKHFMTRYLPESQFGGRNSVSQCVQLRVDNKWGTLITDSIDFGNRRVAGSNGIANVIPNDPDEKIASASIEGSVEAVNGSNGTVYTTSESIAYQNGEVQVQPRDIEADALGPHGEPYQSTSKDGTTTWYIQNAPAGNGHKFEPTPFDVIDRQLQTTYGTFTSTRTVYYGVFNPGRSDFGFCRSQATPPSYSQGSDSNTYSGKAVADYSYNGMSLKAGSGGGNGTVSSLGTVTYAIIMAVQTIEQILVIAVDTGASFNIGSNFAKVTYGIAPPDAQVGSSTTSGGGGDSGSGEQGPLNNLFDNNIIATTSFDAVFKWGPDDLIAGSVCSGHSKGVTTTILPGSSYQQGFTLTSSGPDGIFASAGPIKFPYAYKNKEFWNYRPPQGNDTVHTPYGSFDGSRGLGGDWVLTNGGTVIERFRAEGSPMIYCDGRDVTGMLEAACGCSVEDMTAAALDVPLKTIKKFK